MRSGTLDAPAARAFAVAAGVATAELGTVAPRVAALRAALVEAVLEAVPDAIPRGDPDPAGRLPGIPQPSHVLGAMGVPAPDARGALRFSLGATSTAADVEAVAAAIGPVVERARRAGLTGTFAPPIAPRPHGDSLDGLDQREQVAGSPRSRPGTTSSASTSR